MPTLLYIEKRQRLTISILFRILILLYSFFILYISKQPFSWYINVGIYLVYISIFAFSFGKDKIFSYLRLFNDYLFIYGILYQYGILDLVSFSLLFAPILNSQNHSGEKKSILLYIIPILVIYLFNRSIQTFIIIPFLLFFLINLFESYRSKYIKFHEKLNEVIDNFFTDNTNNNRPYTIYRRCIPLLQDKPFKFDVKDIFCFKLKDGKFSVINGSRFIWNYDINLSSLNKFPESTHNRSKIKNNIPLVINGKKLDDNITFIYNISPHESEYYVFFLVLNSPISPISQIWNTANTLISPFFIRLAKVFEADFNQKVIESSKMLELSTRINYVNSAVKAMHFIRNKLGPIKNYLSMEEDYNNSGQEKKDKIKPHLDKERDKLKSSLTLVLNQADFILEKTNNPFIVSNLDRYGIQQLFSDIRRVWSEYGLEEKFTISLRNNELNEKIFIYYNKIGMELILTNWISNIYKYNTGYYGLEITETEKTFKISFFNSLKVNKGETLDFIKLFSSDNRLEIDKRKSHGLSELKEFLSQMKIQADMFSQEGKLYFTIELIKTTENEKDTNI